jgi:hypothetical protein
MRLITLEFNTSEDIIEPILQDADALKEYWNSRGVEFRLYQDTARKNRYFGTFTTEKSVDEIVGLIQTEGGAKSLFERLKNAGIHILVSVMEEVRP